MPSPRDEREDDALRVVHQIRGRLRLRVPKRARQMVTDALRSEPGIGSATWSPRTGRLLILYDPELTTGNDIVDGLRDLPGLAEAGSRREEAPRPEREPTVASAVTGTVSELDQRVRQSSRGTLGLGTLIPTTLALWAVTEMVRGRVGPLGWSSALWYAHGLFRDYNPPA